MGSCINKSTDIIAIRLNVKQNNSEEPSYTRKKNYLPMAISSLDNKSYKFKKNKSDFSPLYSNDISNILVIPEIRNNENNNINNLNSLREILELFE